MALYLTRDIIIIDFMLNSSKSLLILKYLFKIYSLAYISFFSLSNVLLIYLLSNESLKRLFVYANLKIGQPAHRKVGQYKYS